MSTADRRATVLSIFTFFNTLYAGHNHLAQSAVHEEFLPLCISALFQSHSLTVFHHNHQSHHELNEERSAMRYIII
jgi:hypothetical protein